MLIHVPEKPTQGTQLCGYVIFVHTCTSHVCHGLSLFVASSYIYPEFEKQFWIEHKRRKELEPREKAALVSSVHRMRVCYVTASARVNLLQARLRQEHGVEEIAEEGEESDEGPCQPLEAG